jgi:hypothetical protein
MRTPPISAPSFGREATDALENELLELLLAEVAPNIGDVADLHCTGISPVEEIGARWSKFVLEFSEFTLTTIEGEDNFEVLSHEELPFKWRPNHEVIDDVSMIFGRNVLVG